MPLSKLFIQAADLRQEAMTYQTPFTSLFPALPAFLSLVSNTITEG